MKQEFTMEYYPRLEQLFLSKNFENIRLGRAMLEGFKKPRKSKRDLIHYITLLFLSGEDSNMKRAEYLFKHMSSKHKYIYMLEHTKELLKGNEFHFMGEDDYVLAYSSRDILCYLDYVLRSHPQIEQTVIPKIFRTIDLTNQ